MNKIVHLSLTNKSVPTRFDVVQYATNPAITFVFDDYIPSGTARLYIEKPDGTKIYNSCTISGNNVTYKPTTQSFAAVGINKGQLQIVEPNGTAVSFVMFIDVSENIIDSSAIESQDEFTALEEALRDVSSWESNAFLFKGRLTVGKDLNTLLEQGRYNYGASDNVINGPSGVSWGLVEILRNSNSGAIIQQRITANNRIYLRQTTDSGATWTTWQTFYADGRLNQWTTYTATFKGLTIEVEANSVIPTLIRLKISGTTNAQIASADGYVPIANFPQLSKFTGVLGYVIFGPLDLGQIKIANGEIAVGYTRKFSDGTADNIPAGRGIWIDQAYILA